MKKYILFVAFVFSGFMAVAQKRENLRYGGGADYETLSWGVNVHYVASTFKTSGAGEVYVSSPLTHGVGIGALGAWRLRKNFQLRLSPQVLFANKKLINHQIDFTKDHYNPVNKTTLLEIPLAVRFESERRKNYRPYLVAGGKFSRNISSEEKIKKEVVMDWSDPDFKVQTRKNYFSLEGGFGVDFYFEYFKLSPEIKYTRSLGNLVAADHPLFPVDKLQLRTWQFSIYIQ